MMIGAVATKSFAIHMEPAIAVQLPAVLDATILSMDIMYTSMRAAIK